jgi:multidrug resistance efflux pump
MDATTAPLRYIGTEPATKVLPRKFLRQVNGWKLVIGALAVGSAFYFLTPNFIYVESERAVTNAPLITVRTPIAGAVMLVATAGQKISSGQPIATIRNDHWDPSPLFDTENRLRFALARNQAAIAESAHLSAQRDGLNRDYDLWLQTSTSAARHLLAETWISLRAAEIRHNTAAIILSRYEALNTRKFINQQRLDEARRDDAVSIEDVSGIRQQISRLQDQARALAGGITASDNDRPPTLQRIDEITMHLSALSAEIDAAGETIRQLVSERDIRMAQSRTETNAALFSPADGVVWRLFGAADEQLPANAAVANLIDCKATDVTAIFLQRHLESLDVGRRVSVKLAGRTTPLLGRIASVNGYYEADARIADAVVMKPFPSPSVQVRIALDAPVPGCLVGLEGVARLEGGSSPAGVAR